MVNTPKQPRNERTFGENKILWTEQNKTNGKR